MTLTFVISSLNRGGAEKVLVAMANHYAAQGHRVSVITWADDTSPPVYSLNPAVTRIPLMLTQKSRSLTEAIRNNTRRLVHLRRVLRASAPERIISFMEHTNVMTVLAALGLGIPVIVMERSDPRVWPPEAIWRALRFAIYPIADRIFVQTEEAKMYFPPWLQRRIQCLPNPIAPSLRPRDRTASPRAVVAVGRFAPVKRFDLAIQAIARLRDRFPDARLTLVGDGPLRPVHERLCEILRLDEVVRFVGDVNDVESSLAQATIFLLPSDFEGFPNALGEAMASGLAVIATATAGAKTMIRDGVDGILTPVGDVDALTAALERLFSDSELRERLSRRAPEVVTRFSPTEIARQWEILLAD